MYESIQEFVDSWFEKTVTVSNFTNATRFFWCSERLSTHRSCWAPSLVPVFCTVLMAAWDNVRGHQACYKCPKSRLQKCWKIMFVVSWCQFSVPSFLIDFIALFFWSLFSFFFLVLSMLPVAFLSYSCWTGRSNEIISAICYLNVSSVHWFRPWSWYEMLMKHE